MTRRDSSARRAPSSKNARQVRALIVNLGLFAPPYQSSPRHLAAGQLYTLSMSCTDRANNRLVGSALTGGINYS